MYVTNSSFETLKHFKLLTFLCARQTGLNANDIARLCKALSHCQTIYESMADDEGKYIERRFLCLGLASVI